MNNIKTTLLSAAITSSMLVSSHVMAHAGIYGSHDVWMTYKDANGKEIVNVGGFLEGTSPIIDVTLSHTCAHEAPYPNNTAAGVVAPIGTSALLLNGAIYEANKNAYSSQGFMDSLLANGIEPVASQFKAQDASSGNAWNYTLTGYPSGTQTGGATGPKSLAAPEFKYSPEVARGTQWSTPVAPFVDSHGGSHSEEPYAYLWTGSNFPNERYAVVTLKPTLPKFPKNAAAGVPGRCATQAVLFFPTMQVCGKAKEAHQKKIMVWQMAPTAGFDWSTMGESAKLNSPSLTVNRDLIGNPIPADCPASTDNSDPTTAKTIYVYPSDDSISAAWTAMAKKVKITPTQGDSHGCVPPQQWHADMGHCM